MVTRLKLYLTFSLLLIGFGGISHPIKMTSAKIDVAQKIITINFFADDLTSFLTKKYRQHIDFTSTTIETKALLGDYIKEHFEMTSENKSIELSLNDYFLKDEVLTVTLKVETVTGKITLTNTLLIEAFSNQRNIVVVNGKHYNFDINTTTSIIHLID